MKILSWEFIVLGLAQLTLLLARVEGDSSISNLGLMAPSLLYLAVKVVKSMRQLFSFEEIAGQAMETVVELLTLGLCLCAVVFLIEEADDGFVSLITVSVPIFILFGMHAAVKVSNSTPKLIVALSNMLFPTLTVCTLNGTCSPVYLSILSPLLSALGVSVADLVTVLYPVSYILLVVTLISVLSKSRKVLCVGNVMACGAFAVILIGQIVVPSFWVVMCGNILLVGSVVYANRASKVNNKSV